MRRICAFAMFMSGFALAPLVWAEEVIHFTNGTSMPVSSYRIEGDMVHVDLGGNAMMAFPKSLIERFEKTDQVKIAPSSPKPGGGRMIASSRNDAGASRASRIPQAQPYEAGAEPEAAVPARALSRARELQKPGVGWGGAVDQTGQSGHMPGAGRAGVHYVAEPGPGAAVSRKRVALDVVGGAEPFPSPAVPAETPVEVEPPVEQPEYPPEPEPEQ